MSPGGLCMQVLCQPPVLPTLGLDGAPHVLGLARMRWANVRYQPTRCKLLTYTLSPGGPVRSKECLSIEAFGVESKVPHRDSGTEHPSVSWERV